MTGGTLPVALTASVPKANEAEAFQYFYKLMAASGGVEVSSTVTFNELCHMFIACSKENNASSTTSAYLHFLADFDDFYDGPVANLKKSQVESWLNKHEWEQSTRRSAITSIKRFLNWSYEEGHIAEIPRGIRSLKRPPTKQRETLISSEQHQLIMKNTDEAFRTYLFALHETGARPGEVRSVTAQNVDLLTKV